MGIQSAFLKRNGLLQSLGSKYLSSKYPAEFEYYLCAFELIDSNNNTVQYFLFPIMPSQIREKQPQNVNIKKTMSGITTMTSPTFNPISINLNGNFGRSFKVIKGSGYIDLITNFVDRIKNTSLKSLKLNQEEFDKDVKTGYGCIKILEGIVKTAKGVDGNNKPYTLIFYNLALGNNYFVKIEDIEFSQDQSSNMIWNYSLSMTAIGNVDDYISLDKRRSNKSLINDDWNRKKTSVVFNKISSMLTPSSILNLDKTVYNGVTSFGQSAKNFAIEQKNNFTKR